MIKILLALTLSVSLNAAQKEKDYVNKYCNGQKEVLQNNVRIDCLTDFVAYEFDFANKWYEAVEKLYELVKEKEGTIKIEEVK